MRYETKSFFIGLVFFLIIIALSLLAKCNTISLSKVWSTGSKSSKETTSDTKESATWKFSYDGGRWTPSVVIWDRSLKEFKCGLIDGTGRWLIGKEDSHFPIIYGRLFVDKEPSGTFQLNIVTKKPENFFLSGNINGVRFEVRNWQ